MADVKPLVPYTLHPQTVEELRERGGIYGEAAVTEARWSAVSLWLMKLDLDPPSLRNFIRVASASVLLMQEADRYRLDWPYGKADRKPPVLNDLSPECRREALLVAAETLADWEAAGSPYLDAARIKWAYQLLASSPAFIAIAAANAAPLTNNQE